MNKKQILTITTFIILTSALMFEQPVEARRYYYDDDYYYYDRGDSTARGVLGGAATGALIGGAFGGGRGAAIGAGVGAGTGLIAGSARYRSKRRRYYNVRDENRALRKDIQALERENMRLNQRLDQLERPITTRVEERQITTKAVE